MMYKLSNIKMTVQGVDHLYQKVSSLEVYYNTGYKTFFMATKLLLLS